MKVSYILHSSIARTARVLQSYLYKTLILQTAVLPQTVISLWDVLRCHRTEEDEGISSLQDCQLWDDGIRPTDQTDP